MHCSGAGAFFCVEEKYHNVHCKEEKKALFTKFNKWNVCSRERTLLLSLPPPHRFFHEECCAVFPITELPPLQLGFTVFIGSYQIVSFWLSYSCVPLSETALLCAAKPFLNSGFHRGGVLPLLHSLKTRSTLAGQLTSIFRGNFQLRPVFCFLWKHFGRKPNLLRRQSPRDKSSSSQTSSESVEGDKQHTGLAQQPGHAVKRWGSVCGETGAVRREMSLGHCTPRPWESSKAGGISYKCAHPSRHKPRVRWATHPAGLCHGTREWLPTARGRVRRDLGKEFLPVALAHLESKSEKDPCLILLIKCSA